MAIHSLKPAPKDWVSSLPIRVGQWIERLTRTVITTGRVDVTLDPESVSANTTEEQTFTVEGAREGDGVIVTKPTHTAGLGIANARVSATDTVAITYMNATGSAIDPPEETYRVWLIRWDEG